MSHGALHDIKQYIGSTLRRARLLDEHAYPEHGYTQLVYHHLSEFPPSVATYLSRHWGCDTLVEQGPSLSVGTPATLHLKVTVPDRLPRAHLCRRYLSVLWWLLLTVYAVYGLGTTPSLSKDVHTTWGLHHVHRLCPSLLP